MTIDESSGRVKLNFSFHHVEQAMDLTSPKTPRLKPMQITQCSELGGQFSLRAAAPVKLVSALWARYHWRDFNIGCSQGQSADSNFRV